MSLRRARFVSPDKPLFFTRQPGVITEFAIPLGDLEKALGPPTIVDLAGEGLGPERAWLVQPDCGLLFSVLHLEAIQRAQLWAQDFEPEHALAHLDLVSQVDLAARWINPEMRRPEEWAVVRQNDHGASTEIARSDVHAHAACFAQVLEDRAHKQMYLVERRGPPAPVTSPSWRNKRLFAIVRTNDLGHRETVLVYPNRRFVERALDWFETEPRHKQTYEIEELDQAASSAEAR